VKDFTHDVVFAYVLMKIKVYAPFAYHIAYILGQFGHNSGENSKYVY